MLLKITTPVPSSRLSLSKKLKNSIIQIRGSSQTPTLRKKFSPHLNKSFNCYEEPSVLPSYSRQSPQILRDSLAMKKTKNRLRVTSKLQTSQFVQAKNEMASKNYRRALDLLNKVIQEDDSNDVIYCRGVCMMHLKLYNDAIADLKKVKEMVPAYDPQLYIALYMSYLYLGDYPSALRALNEATRTFPKCSKVYLLRGQMLNKLKKYDKALRDFKKTDDLEAHLYIGESLKGLNQFEKALKYFESAINVTTTRELALIERAKLLYKLRRFSEASCELKSLMNSTEPTMQIFYYQAKIYLQENDLIQAGLLFEQVTQKSHDSTISLKAICKLALIKIKEKDFYGALHTFHRTYGRLNSKKKQSLFQYTEAVVSLMKRKFKDGINILSVLITENVLKDYIINCYLFRAYGYYATGEFQVCIDDYKIAAKHGALDKASEFNFAISKGIIKSYEDDFKGAWKIFKSLRGLFPKNPIPEISQVCILLNKSIEDNSILKKAARIIDAGIKRRSDSEILFIKSLISYFQYDHEKALGLIKESIDKAEENVAQHYAMRAFCNLSLKIYSEAVQDFTISLQLNEKLSMIYPYRGVCAYLSEDYSLALDDFLFHANSSDLNSIILSAKLLMFTACYTEAIQLLRKSEETDESLALLGNAYMMCADYNKAIEVLKRVKHLDVSQDILFLEDIKIGRLNPHGSGYIFKKKYALWGKGLSYMYEQQYSAAIDVFQDVLEIMHSNENEIFNDNIIIEEENCEVLYNIALCNALNPNEVRTIQQNREHALLILKELAEVVNVEHRGQLYLICAIIELGFNRKDSAEVMLQESAKCSPESCRQFLDNELLSILPLHTGNEVSSAFELITIPNYPKVTLRPAITLPKILPPLEAANTCEILKEFFSFKSINPRPEAPWLNRNKGSIQFTDSILDLDVEESRKNSKKINIVPKQCRSQEIRKKNSSFVKISEFQPEQPQVEGLLSKIKEICS